MKEPKYFSFQSLTPAIAESKESLKQWHESNPVTADFLGQLRAFIATKTTFRYTEDGKIDSKHYINDNFAPDNWHRGLWLFLMTEPRGNMIVGRQYDNEYKPYSSLVPLILAAHKLINNIPYSSWSKEGLGLVVNPSLLEAMTYEGDLDFTTDELVEFRNQGLVIQTGKLAGQSRNPVSATMLYGIIDPRWKALPKLTRVMLAQIWLAHPENRTDLMILDPRNWDKMPKPLESGDIFTPEPKKVEKLTSLPWDM